MKFLIKRNLEYTALLQNLIIAVISILSLYLLLNIFLHYFVIGMDIASISATLYGNEDAFIEPILLDSLLLQVHIDLFMNIITLMILSSIYIRYFSHAPYTKLSVHLLFLSGVLAPISLLIAYFTSVVFVYIWIISFILEHILGLIMGIIILKKLLTK